MSLSGLSPRFWVAAGIVTFVLLVAILGPLIVHTSPNATVGGLYDPPQCCGTLILGTDNEGQSVIANLVYGTRTSLIVGLLAGLIATAIGLLVGLVAGYRGGWIDDVLTAITNVGLAIPAIVVIILVSVSLPKRNIYTLALVIGLTAWFWVARAVRAQASSIRTREHIDVARLSGAGFWSILAPRRPAVPVVVRRDGGRPAGLRRDPVRVDAEPAGPRARATRRASAPCSTGRSPGARSGPAPGGRSSRRPSC